MSLSPISQKCHDISYAVFRCAAVMTNAELRKEIENAAVDFLANLPALSNIKDQMSDIFASPVDKLERLISLAESVEEMKTVNAMVLRRELGNLQTAIQAHQASIKLASTGNDLDISGMFAASTLPNKLIESKKSIAPIEIKLRSVSASSERDSITDRQRSILRHVREIPFCRLRNILEAMPEVSERTIRNDIQNLIEKQLVKRIGGGGPNSYFESLEVSLPTQTAITR